MLNESISILLSTVTDTPISCVHVTLGRVICDRTTKLIKFTLIQQSKSHGTCIYAISDYLLSYLMRAFDIAPCCVPGVTF